MRIKEGYKMNGLKDILFQRLWYRGGFTIMVAVSGFFMACYLFTGCSSKKKETFSEEAWTMKVEQTKPEDFYKSNVKGNQYFSPWMKMDGKSLFDVLGWKLSSKPEFTKEETKFLPEVLKETAQRIRSTKGNFILWIGHNSFLVRVNNIYFLTDPIFSDRALLPKRLTPPALKLRELNKLVNDLHIIISHNHYDHLDRWSMKNLPETARVFVPMGLKGYVEKMNKSRVQEMNWWQETDLGRGMKLVCLPAQHWSMRISQGRNRSLWGSWLLITPAGMFYFGGDSGYFKGFTEIQKRYPDIDYAFMATTAYRPRWFMHYQHMNVPEAVNGFRDLGARYFIQTQWGTFHLGNEPAGYPGLDLKRYIKSAELDPKRFKVMDIGEIWSIP
jgi:N-acyl-phosphatidylethanolamine-hydrolysing phospholipase D